MPLKSRHSKRKHSTRTKERNSSLSGNTRQRIAVQDFKPLLVPNKDSAARTPAPTTAPVTDNYDYVIVELKRIGILTGLILAILFALAWLLP